MAINIKLFRDYFSEHPTPAADVLPKQFEPAFAGWEFEIESGDIIDPEGNQMHGRTLLENLASEGGGEFRIQLILRPVPQGQSRQQLEAREVLASRETISDEAIREAIEKLRRLELEAKMPFVALRFFRDRHLNGDHQLFQALKDRGVLSLSKTENPNDPDHPVTTIRANRENALVKEVYERPREGHAQGPSRRRIQVQGPPLSQMILADRR